MWQRDSDGFYQHWRTLDGHRGWVTNLRFEPNGGRLVSIGNDFSMRFWSLPEGRLEHVVTGLPDQNWDLAFSPDGRQLATSSSDGAVRIWQVPSSPIYRPPELKGIESMVVCPRDGCIIIPTNRGGLFRTTAHRPEIQKLFQHDNWITEVVVSPDGENLACASTDGSWWLWRMHHEGGTLRLQLLAEQKHPAGIWDLDFSRDGSTLATVSHDGRVDLYAGHDGEKMISWQAHDDVARTLVFAPDMTWLATGSYGGEIRIWQPGDGALLKVLSGHAQRVLCLDVTPDGSLLASGSGEGAVKIWDVDGGQPRQALNGHRLWVSDLMFIRHGAMLVTASGDGTIRLWDVASGKVSSIIHGGENSPQDLTRWNQRLLFSSEPSGPPQLWYPQRGLEMFPGLPHRDTYRQLLKQSLRHLGYLYDGADLSRELSFQFDSLGKRANRIESPILALLMRSDLAIE